MIKFNINIRSNRLNKLGLAPLYITITDDKTRVKKQLKLFCKPNEWLVQAQTLKASTQNAAINLKLANLKQKANQLAFESNYSHIPITAENFLNKLLGLEPKQKVKDKNCFYTFFEDHILTRSVSQGRYKHYLVFANQLKKFSPKLQLQQVNYEFLTKFFAHLFLIQKNQNNTQLYKLKIIKLVINEAYKMGLLEKLPNLNFKIKQTPSNRIALTEPELDKLQAIYNNKTLPEHLQNTLQQFLFMCYTGLRYGDLKNFNSSMVNQNIIYLNQSKTKAMVIIPLNAMAINVLPQFNFKVISNEKTNKNLKQIASLVKINKLTCHIARHTFGTMCLNKGMGLDTVSSMMGHCNTNITKIYAKMSPNFKVQEMAKWG